ncbi:MAG: amidase [Pseudomonadota bacterium]
MAVQKPSLARLGDVAQDLGFDLSQDDLEFFLQDMQGVLDDCSVIDDLPDYLPKTKYPRTPGHRPAPSENPFNAWYVKTQIEGAKRGRLAGKTVAIKDNIAVAGVQMMNGASTLEGYTPDVDATIVTRLLDAGATITGKSQCEYFCLSGGSHTGAQGPVLNPHNPDHSSAGSSSGSAALVANGDVDLAVGGDQGGSIRTPSSYCGIVGLKPTWGLVPYSGAMPIEMTIDHLGPMTRTVADNALMLEVMAGPDGLDPRQSAMAKAKAYSKSVELGCEGLKIGILREGFEHHNSQKDVDRCVRNAAAEFEKLGATVEDVSIPMHLLGPKIWLVIAFEGANVQMMTGNSHGYNWKGLYLTSMIEAHSNWRQRTAELPDTVKQSMLIGEYLRQSGRGRYYAKAQNLARQLRAAYDEALERFDVLLMPTTPMKAPKLPDIEKRESNAITDLEYRQLKMQRASENMGNTFPFDITSHPAISVPCGMSDGLPVGMMLVGRHFEESTLYQLAGAFEQSADWKNRAP